MTTPTQPGPVRWGILGAGGIARAFVAGAAGSLTATVAAVGSRDQARARAFARDNGLPHAAAHGSYDALLSDPDIEAVYIATPHPYHAPWAVRAAQAGKHLLVEKPVAMNRAQTAAVVDAAAANAVFLMEAIKDRCHPQTHTLLELIRRGAVGTVRTVRAEFGFDAGEPSDAPDNRLFNPALGGGAILDVGCYTVALVRLIAGAALGRGFANPTAVRAVGRIGPTAVDEWSSAVMAFENDIVAEVSCAICATLENSARVVGSRGSIVVPDPWLNSRTTPDQGRIIVINGDGEQIHDLEGEHTCFGHEIQIASRAIRAGQTQPPAPAMTHADSLGQMATLDAWRAEIGLRYPDESSDAPASSSGVPA